MSKQIGMTRSSHKTVTRNWHTYLVVLISHKAYLYEIKTHRNFNLLPNENFLIYSGADPGEGHRGQMTPPSETCQGSQKMMYWYDSNGFKLSFLYFYKI